MVLSFSQRYPRGRNIKGKPTNFKPKSLKGLKIHSMREDVHNRWRVGMDVQLAHGVRTKHYDCFMTATIKSIQLVVITYEEKRNTPKVTIDGRELGIMEMIVLASNDGFDSMADFLEWFDADGTYKLLHWTDYTYDGDVKRLQLVNDKYKAMAEL